MLVQGPGTLRSTSALRRTPMRAADAGLGLVAVPSEEPPTAPAAARLATLAAMGAVLAAQEHADDDRSRRRALRRGGRLLDRLDELRLSLLEGQPTTALRRDLETVLREAGETSGAGGLAGVVREIELRAAVELAKLERDAAHDGSGRSSAGAWNSEARSRRAIARPSLSPVPLR